MTSHNSSKFVFAILLLCIGCLDKPTYNCWCANITNYEVSPTTTTPDGIDVDDSGMAVDLDLLDRETTDLEQCLRLSIDRLAFVVKIAPNWFTSPGSSQQGFPCSIDPSLCFGGQPPPNPDYLCACAGAVQPPNIVVLPPNLLAYRHELIHLITHAVHGDPKFAQCENPLPNPE
ncbi:MAG: hypothetical protein A2563_03135 [Candidatus Magasanikbacteria bacterium RIFOXYD1_FULL_40_23]|uniref:Uncharacterized protein n=1 Tax=Candidatus Magasanikbacteria bacterium RIFOXYD1_FULL_40_23 TaxID=1798705 RepID=A0A1F6P911_9BACT|nr:MAG: hypothetical protein A2563_03135 [Candidatus Magasanikbacteria bacterium RIFOXYD1_FULL_40_23]